MLGQRGITTHKHYGDSPISGASKISGEIIREKRSSPSPYPHLHSPCHLLKNSLASAAHHLLQMCNLNSKSDYKVCSECSWDSSDGTIYVLYVALDEAHLSLISVKITLFLSGLAL